MKMHSTPILVLIVGISHAVFAPAAPRNVQELGEGDVSELDQPWANDPQLDPSWLKSAARTGQRDAAIAKAAAKSELASGEAHIQGLEQKFAEADAHNAALAVQESKEELQAAKDAKRQADKRAVLDSIAKDDTEKRGLTNILKNKIDAEAPDSKDFLTNDRKVENEKVAQEMHDDIETASGFEEESDAAADRAARQLRIKKQEFSDAQQQKMLADSMLSEAKRDRSTAVAVAARSKSTLTDLSHAKAVEKEYQDKTAPSEDYDYAMDDTDHLVRIKHDREDSDGHVRVFSLVGNKMATMRLPEKEAVALQADKFKYLTAYTPGDDIEHIASVSTKLPKDATKGARNEDSTMARMRVAQKLTDEADGDGEVHVAPGAEQPDLGQGSPTQLMSPRWANNQQDTPGVSNIDHTLSKISSIVGVLNKEVHATNSADDSIFGDTLSRVTTLSGTLKHNAATTLKLASKKGDLRSAADDSSSKLPSHSEEMAISHKQIGELKAKLAEKEAENREQKRRLDIMLANQGNNAEISQRIADTWAKKHFADMDKEARQFTIKLRTLKKTAERKHMARVSTAQWLAQEKVVDESADDLRMQDYKADRAAQHYLDVRERAIDETQTRKVLTKKRLWALQEFEGYGPKMSEERATASASARKLAKDREDAKTAFHVQDNLYNIAVRRQLQYLQQQGDNALQMLKALKSQMKTLKAHYQNKLAAMKYKLEAEILRRTSCRGVEGQLTLAAEKCECKQMGKWVSNIAHDECRVHLVTLSSANSKCERNVQRCKIAYRKAGLVYSAPIKNGTLHSYAVTGQVPTAHYHVDNVTETLNPKALTTLTSLEKDPDGFDLPPSSTR